MQLSHLLRYLIVFVNNVTRTEVDNNVNDHDRRAKQIPRDVRNGQRVAGEELSHRKERELHRQNEYRDYQSDRCQQLPIFSGNLEFLTHQRQRTASLCNAPSMRISFDTMRQEWMIGKC